MSRRPRSWGWLSLLASGVVAAVLLAAHLVLSTEQTWRERAARAGAGPVDAVAQFEALRRAARESLSESDPRRREDRWRQAHALLDAFDTGVTAALIPALRTLEGATAGAALPLSVEVWFPFEQALAQAARAQAEISARRLSEHTAAIERDVRLLVAWTLLAGSAISGLAGLLLWRRASAEVGRFERLAHTDELTGLPNRRASERVGAREFSRLRRYRRGLSVIVFDLDEFKQINDRHGHAVGDRALAAFGGLLGRSLRGTDFAARIGGEEFLLIAPELDLGGAERLAERLRLDTMRLEVRTGDGSRLPLRVSAGVAFADSRDASFQALVQRADLALYVAKQRGRNQVFAQPSSAAIMDPEVQS